MSEMVDTILRYLLSGAIGFVLGSVTMYHKAKIAGVSVILPSIPKSSRTFTAVIAILALVTTFSVISGRLEANRAADCDRQFREAIIEAARINTEDRELEREDDRLRSIRDEALDELTRTLAAGEDQSRAFASYDSVVAEEHRQRDDLDDRRGELQKARESNPYPTPTCGL